MTSGCLARTYTVVNKAEAVWSPHPGLRCHSTSTHVASCSAIPSFAEQLRDIHNQTRQRLGVASPGLRCCTMLARVVLLRLGHATSSRALWNGFEVFDAKQGGGWGSPRLSLRCCTISARVASLRSSHVAPSQALWNRSRVFSVDLYDAEQGGGWGSLHPGLRCHTVSTRVASLGSGRVTPS